MLANRIPKSQLPLSPGALVFPGYGHCLTGRVTQDLGKAMSLTVPGEFGWEGPPALTSGSNRRTGWSAR